ncbi:MAG: SPOR domain-containing protein [Steroidobacteraceae bacterium]
MRTLFFILLAANLAVFGWTLVTPEVAPLPDSPRPDVPRLELAGEARTVVKAAAPSGAEIACRSIGPFASEDESARAAAAFRDGGYGVHERTEESRSAEGYWVSLPPQRNVAAETRLLARLARAGITDASVLADTDARRVSVGIFSERGRADRRAAELRRLGLVPDVTERLRIGTSWWIDLELRSAQELAEAEAFNRDGTSELELKPCPSTTQQVPPPPAATPAAAVPASPDTGTGGTAVQSAP